MTTSRARRQAREPRLGGLLSRLALRRLQIPDETVEPGIALARRLGDEVPFGGCDRVGRRPLIATGLLLQTVGFAWLALTASAGASYLEIVLPLVVAGIGISMALPTVPTAVLSAVAPEEMGKASGINYMMQRFGAVFAVAIGSSVFAVYGRLGSAASVPMSGCAWMI